MRRRDLLRWMATMPLLGCALPAGEEEDDMSKGVPPWHMWGVSAPFNITLATPNAQFATSQLARAAYRRPTTWAFLVWCNVAQVTTVGANDTFQAFFDLTVGIGRSQVTIPGWVTLGATIANHGSTFLWSNVAPVFGLQNTGLAAGVFPTADVIVAQDIQLGGRFLLTGNVTDTAVGEMGAAFAPLVHVRPDWYRGTSKFNGDETDGR